MKEKGIKKVRVVISIILACTQAELYSKHERHFFKASLTMPSKSDLRIVL